MILLLKSKRISIFTGAFGSGKTELALNYAIKLREKGKKVTAVDLDLINPYFRIRSVREALETRGIHVVSPRGKLAGADVPALPPAILGVLEDSSTYGVVDVGGDDIGAAALGRFKNNLAEGSFNLYFVVNTYRLHTRDVPGILSVLNRVEKASRMQVNALISNPNLGPETDPETILEGHRLVLEAAHQLKLPVAFLGVRRNLADRLKNQEVPLFPLDLMLKLPWQDG
ncbi:MAG TPA: hypothetical protein PL078_00730 [Bacillota bacterium]|nr:hypothetical protein [Peptococcaceae bacterium MAG4]HPZ42502.1 hypothetical protein [Bacillota bacterium]HQD75294.1 hypothetical protein [Bacillota bacterium]HUM57729.1 hypothetical protein [Bacillota bacterium]